PAASSPIPTSIHDGAGGRCAWTRAMRSRSLSAATIVEPGGVWPPDSFCIVGCPRLPNHRHLDLARILELVFDAPRDVLRQPHGFLVGNLFALDHDPDLAPRLQRERFGHAAERVGDAFELFE